MGGWYITAFALANPSRAHAFLYQALGSFHSPPPAAIGAALGAETVDHARIAGDRWVRPLATF